MKLQSGSTINTQPFQVEEKLDEKFHPSRYVIVVIECSSTG